MHRYICPLSQRILKTFNCKERLSYLKKKKKFRFFKFSINFVRTCLIQKSGISFKKGFFFLKAEISIYLSFSTNCTMYFFSSSCRIGVRWPGPGNFDCLAICGHCYHRLHSTAGQPLCQTPAASSLPCGRPSHLYFRWIWFNNFFVCVFVWMKFIFTFFFLKSLF